MCNGLSTHKTKDLYTHFENQIVCTNSDINCLSAFLSILRCIKRNKLCIPIKTVHPHSVTVRTSPQAAIKNEDWARHVRAINMIMVWDHDKYSFPINVGGLENFSGHAPTIFNIIHCDGNENDLSESFGKGLYISRQLGKQ